MDILLTLLAWVATAISWVILLFGCLFIVAGSMGLLRMPDLYSRLHAASVTDTAGALLILIALFLHSTFVLHHAPSAIKLLLISFFTLFTAPTASHALAKTALLSGLVPVDQDGKPLLDSPETAQLLARSKPGGPPSRPAAPELKGR